MPVPAGVLDELSHHVEQHGPGPQGVLLHQGGAFLDSSTFNWRWRAAQAAAGLAPGQFRYHGLRHAFASA